ncbi:hypothetical protein XH92_23235 [Bradyrhizobium sp. CCBAU 53421]|nr:hypothetical protein XH92_23235 [Bradyrhizobium sp. CCBAU 53421]
MRESGYRRRCRGRALSSEVETGSRKENASKRDSRAPFRFHRNGNGSSRPSATSLRHDATLASICSQILVLRVSGMTRRAITKHTAGTTIG